MPALGQLNASSNHIAATNTTTPATSKNPRLRTSISFTLRTSLAYTALAKTPFQNIMNKQPSPNNSPENIEARMRTVRTLWFAMIMSVVMYYVLTVFKGPRESVTPNNTVSLAVIAIGVSTV